LRLTIAGIDDLIGTGTRSAEIQANQPTTMAEKKIAKTSASAAEAPVKPAAAKKAAKKAPAKKSAKAVEEVAATPTPAPAPAAATQAAKKAAKPAAKKSPAKKSAVKPEPVAPAKPVATPDMIARAAYLNYRRRVELGLPGDSQTDWLEAERQLGVSH
jgi:hypothetical protein